MVRFTETTDLDLRFQEMAAWDLEKHQDYYPAEALNEDGCFYNGQIGRCGRECPCFLNGNCPAADEITG
jgi:hypothetical protein